MKEKEIKDHALKHSTAHLLASAITKKFPKSKRTIGPAIDDGFYYDFDNLEISEEDFREIEKLMRKEIEQKLPFKQKEVSVAEAKKLFKDNKYKLELIDEFSKENKKLTIVSHGDYIDLCRGGHIKDTSEIKAFKLTKLAGAYWRGDSKNKMLTRIYGVAFKSEKELKEHLNLIEEAKKRDHKKLGKEMRLFTFSELVGPGLPLWTPKGTILRELINDFIWSLREKQGYQKVTIPHITKKELYITSGHWDKFKDDLFRIKTREGHEYAMKPMNCPHHAQIFASSQHSYKEMPQRYCETTMMYRDEQSGELSGLTRVRSITIDDAHIFCTKDQIEQEVSIIWDIIDSFYKPFGFELSIRLSTHDPDNFKAFLGKKEEWESAEKQLLNSIKNRKITYYDGKGEAAFYGPKIDFIAKDSLGREWQVATIQLDFNQPERFDLKFTNKKGNLERVVMIHSAVAGSFERFLGVLIEHCAGNFPLWLNPEQVRILTVTDRNNKYAEQIYNKLKEEGLRVTLDQKSHSIGKKVREAQVEKVNYMLTLGDKEQEKKTLAVRTRDGKVKFDVKLDTFIKEIKKEIDEKR